MQVCWFTLESLTANLGRAAVVNSVTRAVNKIARCDFIVVDGIGMLPCGQAAAEAFYRVIDAAYERRSVVVTSNLHLSKTRMFRRTCARRCLNSTGSPCEVDAA
ncbi:ATP-binding protein [Kitasatospora sp. NPDC098663]|uniref:ATP-binding protein n=1 Tax=Kitasatospora sp. NPDC098663 TaxID=3364096 RepID=UPI00381C1EB5